MSAISYFPRVFSGLLDPKSKTSSLERVSVTAVDGNLPVFLASYKNHASFALNFINDPAPTIVKPPGLLVARKQPALSRNAVLFSALDTTQKEENIYLYTLSDQSTRKIAGITGNPVSIAVFSSAGSNTTSFAIVVTSDGFFTLSSKDLDRDNGFTKVKIQHEVEILKNIRAVTTGDDGRTIILNSSNEVQVWKFSESFSSAKKIFQAQVEGIGIVFTKFVNEQLYAVSNSGSLLSRWSSLEAKCVRLERTFDAPITSIYADSEYVILGHPKNLVELVQTSDLVSLATYTCSDDPEVVPKIKSSKVNSRRDLFQSFQDMVLNVERYGDFIIASSDRSVCVWSISLKKLFNPIKLRETKGKIVSKLLVVDKTASSVSIYAAVSRTVAQKESDETPSKISPKDLRIDILSWKIPADSLKKAEQRKLRDAEYQQSLSNLLSRDVANSLLQDVGFAHRLFYVSQSSRYDANFVKSLVVVSNSIRRLPVYLTAAVDENLKELEKRHAAAVMAFQAGGMTFPLPMSNFFLHRTSLSCSVMCDFLFREGESFVKSVWGPLMRKLKRESAWDCNYRLLYQAARKSGMSRQKKRELRLQAKQMAQENTEKVVQWAKKFMDALLGAERQVPETVKELLRYIFAKTREYITDELSDALLRHGPMELFFHDFLVAFLVAPSMFGILDKVDFKVQINLGQIGKIVDHIGLSKLDAEHPLAEYSQRAFGFICKLVGVDPIKAASKKSKNQTVETQVVQSKPKNIKLEDDKARRTQNYYNVAEFIVDNSPALAEATESNNFALEAETSVLLQKIAKQDSNKGASRKESCTVFCIPSSEEDGHDNLGPDMKMFSGSFQMQENLSSQRRGLRSASADDIPFSNLFTVDPREFDSTREWLMEEAKHHSFAIVLFFRGAWCPFCGRYMRAWDKYVAPVLKRDGLIVAVSSQTQTASKKNIAEWKITYPLIGDPLNELAAMFGVEIDPNPMFKHGMAQPAIVGLSRTGEAVYFWKSPSTIGNILGSSDRPRPYNVLESVVKELKRPKGSNMTSGFDDEITKQSTTQGSETPDTANTSTASDD